MSMLAERRRKHKLSPNPCGKLWSEGNLETIYILLYYYAIRLKHSWKVFHVHFVIYTYANIANLDFT